MLITRISIKNPVFATMVMIGITVLGVFSYARLRVEQMQHPQTIHGAFNRFPAGLPSRKLMMQEGLHSLSPFLAFLINCS